MQNLSLWTKKETLQIFRISTNCLTKIITKRISPKLDFNQSKKRAGVGKDFGIE